MDNAGKSKGACRIANSTDRHGGAAPSPHVSTAPSFSPQTAQVLTLLKPQVDEVKEGDKWHTASRQ